MNKIETKHGECSNLYLAAALGNSLSNNNSNSSDGMKSQYNTTDVTYAMSSSDDDEHDHVFSPIPQNINISFVIDTYYQKNINVSKQYDYTTLSLIEKQELMQVLDISLASELQEIDEKYQVLKKKNQQMLFSSLSNVT